MNALVCLFGLLTVSSLVLSHPGWMDSDEDDLFVKVPIKRPFFPFGVNTNPLDDFDTFPFSTRDVAYRNPFQDAFSEMDKSLRNMRKEMDYLARKAFAAAADGKTVTHQGGAGAGAEAGTEPGTVVTTFGSNFGVFDPSKYENKTISKTELIDGNIVETNETVYSSGDKTRGQVYRVKMVKVRPQNEYATQQTPTGVNSESPKAGNKDAESINRGAGDREEMDNDVNSRKGSSNVNDLNA